MNQTTPLLTLQVDPETGLQQIQAGLVAAGLDVELTFDLQAARAGHAGCTCPHHGTENCTCQMVVLCVYGQGSIPAALVIHGREGVTQCALADHPGSGLDRALAARIQAVLCERPLAEPSAKARWPRVAT